MKEFVKRYRALLLLCFMLICTIKVISLTGVFKEKKPIEPRKCRTTREVLLLNAKREMFIDSIAICKIKDRERLADSIIKYVKLLED